MSEHLADGPRPSPDLHAAERLWNKLFTRSTDLSLIGLVNATGLDALPPSRLFTTLPSPDLHAAELLWNELFTRSTDLSLIGLVNATGLDAAETLSHELSPRPTQSTRR